MERGDRSVRCEEVAIEHRATTLEERLKPDRPAKASSHPNAHRGIRSDRSSPPFATRAGGEVSYFWSLESPLFVPARCAALVMADRRREQIFCRDFRKGRRPVR